MGDGSPRSPRAARSSVHIPPLSVPGTVPCQGARKMIYTYLVVTFTSLGRGLCSLGGKHRGHDYGLRATVDD